MAWIYVLIAGVFEIVWALCLKLSDGLSRPLWVAWTVAALILSMVALALSLKSIPLSTAYAVWTGIGAAGTALVGMAALGEPVSAARLACIGLIVIGILGLKLASSS
jgi:quaternary ammonium compound-resistance protein SugE